MVGSAIVRMVDGVIHWGFAGAALALLALASVADAAQEDPPAVSATGVFTDIAARVSAPDVRDALLESLSAGPRLEAARVSELLGSWRETGGIADGSGWILAARLWRQAGAADSAFEALRSAAELGDTPPPGLLSLEVARTAFLADRIDIATETFWDGCERASEAVLDEYRRDFAAVATPGEAVEWAAADSVPADRRSAVACDVLRRAWARRASRAGLTVMDRLALHYERLRVARVRYSMAAGQMRLGPRTRLLSAQIGRPKEAGLDDRGLIYVRFGEPDRTASFVGSTSGPRVLPGGQSQDEGGGSVLANKWYIAARDLRVSPTCYHPNVSWAYDFPDGTRLYHFSPLEGTANWWLLENLHDIYHCGDPSSTVGEVGSTAVLTPAVSHRSAPVNQIAWLVLPDLYLSRTGLDPAYSALAHRIAMSGPNTVEDMDGLRSIGFDAVALQREFAEERQASFGAAADALTHVLDRPLVRPEVPLIFEILQFRTGGPPYGERTRVWLNAVVEGERLGGRPTADGGSRYVVEATFSAVGEQGELWQQSSSFSLNALDELDTEAGVPVRVALDLPPGTFDYSVVVRDAHDDRERPAGNWRHGSLRVRSFEGNLPQLSDVAFAPDSGGSWSPSPGVALPAAPVHITDTSGRAWLYFEAYGLSPRGGYVTEVRLQPEDEGQPFTLTYQGPVPTSDIEAVRRLLRLDLADTEPGEYRVRITVTDALGRSSLPLETSLVVK